MACDEKSGRLAQQEITALFISKKVIINDVKRGWQGSVVLSRAACKASTKNKGTLTGPAPAFLIINDDVASCIDIRRQDVVC